MTKSARIVLQATLAVALTACKARTDSALKDKPSVAETLSKGEPIVVSALRATAFLGEKNYSCEVKTGTQFVIRKIATPSTLIQGYAKMSDKEFLFVELQSDFAKLFNEGSRVSRLSDDGRPVPCNLTKGYLAASDFEIANGPPPPPPTASASPVASVGPTVVATLAPSHATLAAPKDTFFKKTEADSSTLPVDQKCKVPANLPLSFRLLKHTKADYLRVSLLNALPSSDAGNYCGINAEGFLHTATFYGANLRIAPWRATVFKATTGDSTTLAAAQKCAFSGEVTFVLTGMEMTTGVGLHFKAQLFEAIASGDGSAQCARGASGYFFFDHFAQ